MSNPEPLLPPDWQALSPLVDSVLDAAPEKRAALIVELCPGDVERQRVLQHLVAECERDNPLLDRPAAERFPKLANESPASLLPELVGERYRTGRELGRGGMARVYLARDLKHGRDVAIKVIHPQFSASLGHDRFLRETEIAARLRHPNIVPLYDSGEVAGTLYFVMPYEEGPSLRERLSQGALPVADALNVLRDVARALAYAHEHGVVHRDVKPDNVMLSGGAAVVTDFGIAKAMSAALTTGAEPTLTQIGSAIGTPAYMAPEQAVGDPATDHRADVYSFGCLAYELFVGKPPFHGLPTHLLIAAHVATVPAPVTERCAAVPTPVAQLIAKCLEKKPDDRPQSARELLSALDGAATAGAPIPSRSVAGRRPWSRWSVLTLAAGVIGVAAYLAMRDGSSSAPITIAVLPFSNIAADSSIDFLAGGLAEEVASALARVPGIQIQSRSGARAYSNLLTVDVTEAGKKLNAEYVMFGAVRQEGERWRLSAYLERAADKASVWDSQVTISPDQQNVAAEEIAASLVSSLQKRYPKMIGSATRLAANQRTTNREAFRLNMRGQEILARRSTHVDESANLFRQAIRADTLYAQAYSGLGMALSLFPYMQAVHPKNVQHELVSAARRAIALDSTLAQPHVALGVSFWFDYLWDSAEVELKKAIQLDGHNVEARIQYSRHLRYLGRNAESLRQLQVARAEDPASAVVLSHLAHAYSLNHQLDSALVESARALENDPANITTKGYRGLILLEAGRFEEAAKFARGPGMSTSLYVLSRVDSAAGRQELLALNAMKPERYNSDTRRAMIYLGLGDTASALSALERATDTKEHWQAGNSTFDPMYDSVRASPRFRALLRRVRLAR